VEGEANFNILNCGGAGKFALLSKMVRNGLLAIMLKLTGRYQSRRCLTLLSHSYRSRTCNATAISAIPLTSIRMANRSHR
jgi:hypothetical protein